MNQDIAKELVALKNKRDNMIHVPDVHKWAERNRNSAIAQKLEWDDARAGYQYRLDQIRNLIEVHIVSAETGVRTMVSLRIDQAKKGGGYRELSAVLPNASMRTVLVHQIVEELARVIGRYPQLSELDSVSEAIEIAKRQIEAQSMPLAAD